MRDQWREDRALALAAGGVEPVQTRPGTWVLAGAGTTHFWHRPPTAIEVREALCGPRLSTSEAERLSRGR